MGRESLAANSRSMIRVLVLAVRSCLLTVPEVRNYKSSCGHAGRREFPGPFRALLRSGMKKIWLRIPRWIRRGLVGTAVLLTAVLLLAACAWWYLHPPIERVNGVVYGERDGRPLTLDVLTPANPNGLGVAFMVSGGWKSAEAGEAPEFVMGPLLRRGYTIFAVCHISQPDSTVMEIIEDVHRGIRFIRHHADRYGIDPQRIGVSGGSAGGHLSLMLATRGGPGPEDAADPIDRQSSAVQAVAIFYPVTDLLNMGESTENPGDGGPPISFVKAFGEGAQDMETWKQIGRDCSPIYHVSADLPPTLIYHGNADTLTPLDQSVRFREEAVSHGCDIEVVVHDGGKHGWPTMLLDIFHFADWFDRHLKDD